MAQPAHDILLSQDLSAGQERYPIPCRWEPSGHGGVGPPPNLPDFECMLLQQDTVSVDH